MEDFIGKKIIRKEHNPSNFFKFFESSYSIEKGDKSFYLRLDLKLKFKDTVIGYYKKYDDDSVVTNCNICERKNCVHIDMLVNDVYDKYNDKINEEIISVKKEIENEIREFNQEKFDNLFANLTRTIEHNDKMIIQEPVDLEINIDTYSKKVVHKIGRNKKYKIKNLHKFLIALENNETIKYGKELEFIHDFSMFKEKDQKYLKYLYHYKNSNYFVELPYDEEIASLLFNTYKECSIFFDEVPYLIRLKKVKPLIFIDSEYRLSILNLNEYNIIHTEYLISKNENVVDILSGDYYINKLVASINELGNVSIENFKDEFKYSIYLKYMDYFMLDKQIESEFYFEDVDIKAYFDFEKGNILLNTKLFKNDNEIDVKLLDKYSSKKYYQYLNMINNYGFVDNVLSDESSVINFLKSDLSKLKLLCEVYLSESIINKKIITFAKPNVRINYENDLMSVFFENSKYDEDELKSILKAIRKKKKYVILKDNIIVLEKDAESFEKIIDDFNLDDGNLLETKERPLYLAFKSYSYENDGVLLDKYLDNMISDISNFKRNDFKINNISGELRKYQKEGYNWLSILYKYNLGGILADDMGLGKTLQMIALLSNSDVNKPSLIISPKSLIYNWKKEFEKFSSNTKVEIIYGGVKERIKLIGSIKNDEKCIYLSSYDMVRSDIDLYENIDFDTIVLDEAQFIKNVNAQKTKSIKKLKSSHKYVLTGTPIENNIIDLWSIFDFIMPGYLTNLNDFKRNYEHIEDYSSIIYKKVAPFILRRTKKEVLKDLPEKYEKIITCEFNDEQRKIYESQMLEARNILGNDGKAFDVLYLLTRLRQVCVDPMMFIENYKGGSSKIETCIETIKDRINDGHRILVFSQFVKALDILEKRLKVEGITYKKIIGDTSSKDRINICEEFNASNKIKLVLISLKAGGTGLNLIGADVVIHLDPWWNVAVENQASDRAHRIGQTRNVEIIKLIVENSIEQKVLDLQRIKRELFDKIISSDDSSITKLSKDDLKFILE